AEETACCAGCVRVRAGRLCAGPEVGHQDRSPRQDRKESQGGEEGQGPQGREEVGQVEGQGRRQDRHEDRRQEVSPGVRKEPGSGRAFFCSKLRRLPKLALALPAHALELKPWTGGATPPLELSDLDGKTHRLADYRGRAVLVNFWAT